MLVLLICFLIWLVSFGFSILLYRCVGDKFDKDMLKFFSLIPAFNTFLVCLTMIIIIFMLLRFSPIGNFYDKLFGE